MLKKGKKKKWGKGRTGEGWDWAVEVHSEKGKN